MPANRSTSLRRGLAAVAALPLLTLAACGYGSDSKDDSSNQKVAAGAKKIDGLDSVKIGYFGNLTHGTALVGVNKGYFQKALGATKATYQVFNAGPSEIERSTPAPSTSAGSAPPRRSTATPSPRARTCASSAVRPPAV